MSNDYLSEDYHKELAERYNKRKLDLSPDELARQAAILGFKIDPQSIEKSTGGNVSGTFLAGDFVMKIQNDKNRHEFVANKIVSDKLSDTIAVVEVLAYDWFDKTDYEILIMRRGRGKLLLEDFYKFSELQQKDLFEQILGINNAVSEISCADFGEIRKDQSFESFKKYLLDDFEKYTDLILREKLCDERDINTVSGYIYEHIDLFNDDTESYLNHTDLHTGNVLFDPIKNQVTLLFDFDGAIKGPKYLSLPKIIGAIDDPSQFVEGTKYFEKYKDKKFNYLLPILQEKMNFVLSTPNLVPKLTLQGIIESMKWISENWSAEWNKNQIQKILNEELSHDQQSLQNTYYGKIFESMKK